MIDVELCELLDGEEPYAYMLTVNVDAFSDMDGTDAGIDAQPQDHIEIERVRSCTDIRHANPRDENVVARIYTAVSDRNPLTIARKFNFQKEISGLFDNPDTGVR